MDIEAVAGEIRAFFESRNEPLYVVGAVALVALGIGRQTEDLDFLARKSFSSAVIEFMERSGFETLHRSPGYSNHLHPEAARGRVDFIYSNDETIERIGAQAREVVVGDLSFRAPSPEHLAAMKIVAMKNDPKRTWKDLRDIHLLMSLEGVDLEEVERQFEKHGMLERYEQIKETL